jgi:uncharacterized repeat protein (TIGR03803 family)
MTIKGKLTVLYSFCQTLPCKDGQYPAGLVQASNGKLYGTTRTAGVNKNGTVFEISTSGSNFTTLYSFCSAKSCTDGAQPMSAPMQAINGNLYGTTYSGGSHSAGVAYEITTTGLYKKLYSFCARTNCADGSSPLGGLTQDSAGNLYGTTNSDGANAYGTVFEITTGKEFITLHSFDDTDGSYPVGPPIQANDGNLYGLTEEGGATNGGTIYEFTSAGVFSSLYSISTCAESMCTGYYPLSTLLQATNGSFYAGTEYGGTSNIGTVFSYSTGLGAFVKTVPTAAKAEASVIILGNNLTGSTGVSFNGKTGTFTVVSDTEITATVPTGASSGTVSVTTPTGTLNSNPAFQVLK